ncbi:MAG: DNA polymerase I [Deltaproteobacteria bacterium]|nr:DNA polymerase I [Deltaproteobacteria bacterium]
MTLDALPFSSVWAVDFEFTAAPGELPTPICAVARDLRSERTVRLAGADLRRPPYCLNNDCLLVAYYSSAEWTCHAVLGWPMPHRVLDLFCEFRVLTNGRARPAGDGLLGACTYFGIDAMEAHRKEAMRELAMRGGPYASDELEALMKYCQTDVDATVRLLNVMLPRVDLPRALLRGRYMVAAAAMEVAGVPVDVATLDRLRASWDDLKVAVVARIDENYGVFDGSAFSTVRFEAWLAQQGIPWPRLESGRLALDDDTFHEMGRLYPITAPIREARTALAKLRLNDLAVGHDGRNRCMLSAFRASTGRNQPSNSRFIFGPSVWLRSLIRPPPGWGIAYVDWSQQEFGIAAALSGDERMAGAYLSGDPYLAFARQAGAVPAGATKHSHPEERELFKACALGVQYGMREASLARKIGRSEAAGRELLRLHRQTYPRYWRWVEAAQALGMLHGRLWTVFGWQLHVGAGVNPRSLANFPMQSNGAEMLRLACCLATERGIRVCAPVHDAVLIEAPISKLEEVVAETQAAMAEASRVVLSGFELRSDTKVIRHPDRYADPRGARMWEAVSEMLQQRIHLGADLQRDPSASAHPSSLLSPVSVS